MARVRKIKVLPGDSTHYSPPKQCRICGTNEPPEVIERRLGRFNTVHETRQCPRCVKRTFLDRPLSVSDDE